MILRLLHGFCPLMIFYRIFLNYFIRKQYKICMCLTDFPCCDKNNCDMYIHVSVCKSLFSLMSCVVSVCYRGFQSHVFYMGSQDVKTPTQSIRSAIIGDDVAHVWHHLFFSIDIRYHQLQITTSKFTVIYLEVSKLFYHQTAFSSHPSYFSSVFSCFFR